MENDKVIKTGIDKETFKDELFGEDPTVGVAKVSTILVDKVPETKKVEKPEVVKKETLKEKVDEKQVLYNEMVSLWDALMKDSSIGNFRSSNVKYKKILSDYKRLYL